MDHHLVPLTRQGQLAPPVTFSSEGTSVFGCLSSDDQHLCGMRACLQSATLREQRLPPKGNYFPFVYLGLSVAFVESLLVSSHWGPGCERKEAHRGDAAGPTPSEEGFQSGELWMG